MQANSNRNKQLAIPTAGLKEIVEKTGRLPRMEMLITPIDTKKPVSLDRFLSYTFSSSILVPVDTLSFQAAIPDSEIPFPQQVKEGDLISLFANDQQLSTGIIDSTTVEVSGQSGESCTVNGRDLMSQLEDQSAVNERQEPIWANSYTIDQVLSTLTKLTRIPKSFIFRNMSRKPWLFATEPGESKLSALMRYLTPLNSLVWCDPSGKIIVGKPSMAKEQADGVIICSRSRGFSNVLDIKAIRNAAVIPTSILPIWAGQESVQFSISAQQKLDNTDPSVARLRGLKHFCPKTIVVSTPQGASAQDLSQVTQIQVQGGGSNILQAYAKQAMARENQKSLIVEAVVVGHFNESGKPYQVDQVYDIEFDRGDVFERMYLFEVNYSLTEATGEQTRLLFCRLGTIVADIPTLRPKLKNLTGEK